MMPTLDALVEALLDRQKTADSQAWRGWAGARPGLNRHDRRQLAALRRGKGGHGWRVRKQRIGQGKARRR